MCTSHQKVTSVNVYVLVKTYIYLPPKCHIPVDVCLIKICTFAINIFLLISSLTFLK